MLVISIPGPIPARLVLYFLSWSGFLVSFMLRTDINLAIVAMVKTNPQVYNSTSPDTCVDPSTMLEQNGTVSLKKISPSIFFKNKIEKIYCSYYRKGNLIGLVQRSQQY